jgi:hypothetical protein
MVLVEGETLRRILAHEVLVRHVPALALRVGPRGWADPIDARAR